jgi:hypothetical protein
LKARAFFRNKAFGGDEADTGRKIVAQLADLVDRISSLSTDLKPNGEAKVDRESRRASAEMISSSLEKLGDAVANQKTTVSVTNKPSKEFARVLTTLNDTIENTLFPLVRSMDKRIAMDKTARNQLKKLGKEVEALKNSDKSAK